MTAKLSAAHGKTFIMLILLGVLLTTTIVLGEPTPAQITFNRTETATTASAGSSATAGGSFTTLILNATTQTPRWKAYVGNVTGSFGLRDGENYSIYDWGQASASGEVYASRNTSINWAAVTCVVNSSISSEQSYLNHSYDDVDSINNTFNTTVHRTFYVGTTEIANSTCRAIATYVNSTAQTINESADFQEVLLEDDNSILIYAALLDEDTTGYNNGLFDFQMIVPEDEFASTPTTYYFWLELS